MKRYFFIINANNSEAVKVFNHLKKELDQEETPYRTFYTEHKGHAVEIAKKIIYVNKDSIKAIIAVGGDGTIHEVFNGIKDDPEIPLGFISSGSGNDIVRVFAPKVKSVKNQINYIKRTRLIKSDSGVIRMIGRSKKDQVFLSAIGIGLDGEVAKYTNEARYKKVLHKLRLGTFAYVITLFKVLKSYKPVSIEVEIDGQVHTFNSVWLVAIGNLPYYGGGMKICPEARYNDGKLDVCIVHTITIQKLLMLFVFVFWGGHVKFKGVSQFIGRTIKVSTNQPVAVHADGEYKGTTPVSIEINPSSVPIKV
ncbi:diacylglycerol/lipid kinase family protein [Fictibacillus phosphorivorans]|uniref:diacylglycerol/lipid kinase family protein n=1 Tax=Fictibacillus phosphorivorans TaxID=1221500 RepID=UPI002040AC5A|nr:diacylglycerol kinase family protein [Fictibacillus phosphorivorans]MCM3717994.1 diacylglycerol kinase family lipid kinase [Fictibacillus phosphorivorans]MCM3775443.1 diacylglycerol kinase family lipid kinase [Fictibacillus phosphorivorans]